MTKKSNKRILRLIGLMILFIGAAVAYHYSSDGDSKESVATQSVTSERAVEIVQTPKKERGPRPENKRLRDGAKQVEDRGAALETARASLRRIEREMAEAPDERTMSILERKRELIEQAIANITREI